VADLSLPDVDAATYPEATEYKSEVTYTANVRSPDNQTTKKTLVLTLQRVVVKDAAGKLVQGQWMITNLKAGSPAQ